MDMAEMLNKLMSDPSAMAAAAEMAGKLLNNNAQTAAAATSPSITYNEPQPDPLQAAQTPQAPPQSNPMADMLSSALSDPSFMEKIPQITSAMAPLLQSPTGGINTESRSGAAPSLPAQHKAERSEQEKRNALLLALKPYLSPERAEAIDQIIRLTELITLFSLFK